MKHQHKTFSKILLKVLSAAAIVIIVAQSAFCVSEGLFSPVAQTVQESTQTTSAGHEVMQNSAQTTQETSSKTPLTDAQKAQQEKKETILKFVIAMAGVLISSVLIFLGLTIYNKFFVNKSMFADNNSDDALNTPKTVDEAVNFYIKRNKLC